MKHSIFRINNGNKFKLQSLKKDDCINEDSDAAKYKTYSESGKNGSHFDELVNMFKIFLNKTEQIASINKSDAVKSFDIQARNRQVLVDLPYLLDGEIRNQDLQKWVTEVVNSVISSSFYYYSNNQMSFEQAKIFCSQNILKNIATLYQKYSLSPEQFKIIDKHFQNGILQHLATKYPMTESQQINRNLQGMLKQIDNIQDLSNNYFYQTDLIFQYRESGDYNDLIMRMMNDIMRRNDLRSTDHIELTNFADFKEFMENIFEKVEDIDWMNEKEGNDPKQYATKTVNQIQDKHIMTKEEISEHKQKQKNKEIQREKYKNIVKEYTHYLIGRKIPENVNLYTQKQIANMHMTIKHPGILRILTKWCQQLLQKYTTLNYYLTKSSNVKLLKGGKVNNLQLFMKLYLDDQIEKERAEVEDFMKNIHQNNYEMQAALMEIQLGQKGDYQIKSLEKACGKFSIKVVNNLHSYIITYLNRLIHGLMKVSINFHKHFDLSKSAWPYPPNLLTFRLGDLLRCKCSSKQKQILKIFKQFERVSRQDPNKLKIVRIKNRLRKGTNDILINVKFNNLILCQIQLAVKSKVSNFIKLSNDYSHYLYELQRSLFGPLTELCSIWSTLDRRSQIYASLIDKQTSKINKKGTKKQIKSSQMRPYEYPFVCSECSRAYYHSNYLKSHLHYKGDGTNYWRCAKCQIDKEDYNTLMGEFISNEQLINNCQGRYNDPSKPFPQFGIAIYIEAKQVKSQIFRLYESNKYRYLLGMQVFSIYQISEITSKKQLKNFLSSYLVFAIDNKNEQFLKITDEMAKKQYILPKYVRQCYRKEKETISLINQNLSDDDLSKILDGEQRSKQIVKNMFLARNNLTNVKNICKDFPNLKWLEINYNKDITTYEGIDNLKQIETLILDQCPLTTIPPSICNLPTLEVITISESQIKHLPQDIVKWKKIRHIQIDFNLLEDLPNNFGELKCLGSLNLNGNQLKELPMSFEELPNLEKLFLGINNFKQIPLSIFKLQKLKQVYFHSNQIESVSRSFKELKYLQILDLSKNPLKDVQIEFKSIINLKTLILKQNNLKDFPNVLDCQNLQKIQVNNNEIEVISEQMFNKLSKLQVINLNSNKIKKLPKTTSQLKKLISMDISNNQIEVIDDWIGGLTELSTLQADNDQIGFISELIGNCKKLQKLKLNNNQLSKLPINLSKCSSLIWLQLNNNNLTEIPPEYSKMSNLQSLQINNNKIKCLPAECQHLKPITSGIIQVLNSSSFASFLGIIKTQIHQ